MTSIVAASCNFSKPHHIYFAVDGEYVASVWGIAKVRETQFGYQIFITGDSLFHVNKIVRGGLVEVKEKSKEE